MTEKNRDTLDRALRQLPQYDPPGQLWEALDRALTAEASQQTLHSAIREMPSYAPPKMVWDAIEEELVDDQVVLRLPRKRRLRRWVAAASVVLLCSIAGWWWQQNQIGREQVAITYSEETVVAADFLANDWDEDEEAFGMVAAFCQGGNVICQQPEFQILTLELETLNSAREDLKAAITAFGQDPDLIAQLTAIEFERTDLLKKLVAKI